MVSVGAAVSIRTATLAADEGLPAESLTVAVIELLVASTGISVPPKLADQLPLAWTVAVLVTPPHTTLTCWPASAVLVPLTATPVDFSLALTTSLPATVAMLTVGAAVSMRTDLLA